MPPSLDAVSAVPVTPFSADGALDEDALGRVVRRLVDQGVPVIVPCGGTGEFSQLAPAERERVARVAIEAGAGAAVLGGVGGDLAGRPEERRGGEEGRSRWGPDQ